MSTQRSFTAEEVQKKFDSLPAEVQDIVYSNELTLAIQSAGEKNKLHYDQMGRLEMETRNVLLGFTETNDFTQILTKVLEIEPDKAFAVVQDLNELLFNKIRDALKQTASAADKPDIISNPPAIKPPLEEKSVVMPSAAKVPTLAQPVNAQPVAPIMPTIIKPAGLPAMPHVDAMLSQPTVSIAPKPAAPALETKTDTPKPGPIYKTDPYHEPVD
jgi:hypothetical protein